MTGTQKSDRFSLLKSLTRLLVGGILLGSELLEDRLRGWEGIADLDKQTGQFPQDDDPLPETLPDPQFVARPKVNAVDARYALIGLIFESEEKLEGAFDSVIRFGSRIDQTLDPFVRPIKKIGASDLVQEQMDRMTKRGQETLYRWSNRGREEEVHSRQLTQRAVTSTVDQSIHYMAENEAISELIQTQSVSLAEQILELVRAISVSADYFVEGLIRYLFGMRPRYLLPPPSEEVQKQATWTLRDIRHEEI